LTTENEGKKMSTGELPNDNDIPRDRGGRYAILLGTIATLPVAGWLAGSGVVNMFTTMLTDNDLLVTLGGIIGAGGGLIGFMAMKHLFFVSNSTTGILLTTNSLKAFLGGKDIFVPYGPGGPFVSYPWEKRSAENNISIKTATNEFSFSIQCQDGTVNGTGSYRLRPDHENPRQFQTGAAAVADDLKDLILGFLISQVGPMKISAVLKGIAEINAKLKKEFEGDGIKTEFELEHGVFVVDVTLSQLLPSPEVQRTMSGLTEAGFIASGTRTLLGFGSQKKLQEAMDAGKISRADYNHARDRFLSISGNMEGVNVTRYEIDLNASGIEKETSIAIANLLKNTPPQVLAGIAAQASKGSKK
jgi:hypothetical protein